MYYGICFLQQKISIAYILIEVCKLKFRNFNTWNKFLIFCIKLYTMITLKNTRRLECYEQKVDEFFQTIAIIKVNKNHYHLTLFCIRLLEKKCKYCSLKWKCNEIITWNYGFIFNGNETNWEKRLHRACAKREFVHYSTEL